MYFISMLSMNFLHCVFLVKKNKNISFNKIQVCFLYLIVVKKASFFFLLFLQRFSKNLLKVIKSDVFFDFRFKIPSKIIFNLVLLEVVNFIKCIGLVKVFKFHSFCKRQTKYSLIRSPFVFKISQEQLLFDFYRGNFFINFSQNNFLVSEYIEFFIFNSLKKVCLLDIKIFKGLNIV